MTHPARASALSILLAGCVLGGCGPRTTDPQTMGFDRSGRSAGIERAPEAAATAPASTVVATAPIPAHDEAKDPAKDAMNTLTTVTVAKTADFTPSGSGDNPAWERAAWLDIAPVVSGGKEPPAQAAVGYRSRAKALYSDHGLYVLFDFEDQRLTCTPLADFENLFKEDVAEVFLQPDEAQNVYFEYEISPFAAELPLLILNSGSGLMQWKLWHEDPKQKTVRATAVRGGEKLPHAAVSGWTAEVFLPFALFAGMNHVPPKPGTMWRANFFRIDYDGKEPAFFAWSPLPYAMFHQPKRFGRLVFE